MERWYAASTPSLPKGVTNAIWSANVPSRAQLVIGW